MRSMNLILLVMLVGTAGYASNLPLKPGTYVLKDVPCADPPLAAFFTYDGRRFSYPHAKQCHSFVRSRVGRAYTIRETCNALGDGTRTAPSTTVATYRILSSTEVTIGKAQGHAVARYRRCAKI